MAAKQNNNLNGFFCGLSSCPKCSLEESVQTRHSSLCLRVYIPSIHDFTQNIQSQPEEPFTHLQTCFKAYMFFLPKQFSSYTTKPHVGSESGVTEAALGWFCECFILLPGAQPALCICLWWGLVRKVSLRCWFLSLCPSWSLETSSDGQGSSPQSSCMYLACLWSTGLFMHAVWIVVPHNNNLSPTVALSPFYLV